jgi:hypothetical protein
MDFCNLAESIITEIKNIDIQNSSKHNIHNMKNNSKYTLTIPSKARLRFIKRVINKFIRMVNK